MSQPPEPERTPAPNPQCEPSEWRTFRAHAARPELLLPAAALSLGFAIILVQREPLPHPVLSYGLMLCVTAALYLYGREVSRIFDSHERPLSLDVPGPEFGAELSAPESESLPLAQPLAAVQAELLPLPALDSGSLAALEQSVGLATLLEIVRAYLAHAENLIETLATMTGEEQWPDALRVAQDIAGAASGLGLSAVTFTARSFAQQARNGADPHDLRNTAQMIMGEHLRVRRALAELYPSLAA